MSARYRTKLSIARATRTSVRRQSGFSMIELLVVLALVAIISAIVVPQLMRGYDRSRQRASMADMRAIAMANATFHTDRGMYAPNLAALSPEFMSPVPVSDSWGTNWDYTSAPGQYTLTCLGLDASVGPAPPANWYDEPFEADIVVRNGTFVQAPSGPTP